MQTVESSGHAPRGVERIKNVNFLVAVVLATTALFSCSQPSGGASNTDGSGAAENAAVFYDSLAIPDFTVATIQDSAGYSSESIPKDGLLLIKIFSPDCDHCQEEATTYLLKKDSLLNIKTVWIAGSWVDLTAVQEFAELYQLADLDPLAVGKDSDNYLVSYYGLSGIPFAAIYKDNQLLKEYKGSVDFAELIAINNGTFVPQPVDSVSGGE